MDFNATIDLIIKDLDETRKIIDDLKKIPGVPVLQVELAKSKCKSAGDVIALLKEMNINGGSFSDTTNQPDLTKNEPAGKETSSLTDTPENKKEKAVKKGYTKPVVSASEKGSQINDKSAILITDQATVEADLNKAEPVSESVNDSDSSILADRFSHMSTRFNEQLGNLKNEADITEQLNTKPITNLSDAIGINDKFHFIREIFNNDKDAFTQAIIRLEHTDSLADARAIIMSYTGNSEENEAVSKLLSLVKRKIQSNE